MNDSLDLVITKGDDVVLLLTTIEEITKYDEMEIKELAQKEKLDFYSYIMKNLDTLIASNKVTLMDISDCTFTFNVSRSNMGTILFSKTSADGDILLTNPTVGEAEITIKSEDTEEFLNLDSNYFYDLKIVKPTGKKETIVKGKLKVLAGVNGE